MLGDGAGAQARARADRLALAANADFARARRLLATIAADAESSVHTNVTESIANDGLRTVLAMARSTALTRLVDSGCPLTEAHRGIERFDVAASEVEQLSSPAAVFEYLDRRLARLTTDEVALRAADGEDEVSAFCVLILLILSLYILIVIASLFTGNPAYWLPIMLNQACQDLAR